MKTIAIAVLLLGTLPAFAQETTTQQIANLAKFQQQQEQYNAAMLSQIVAMQADISNLKNDVSVIKEQNAQILAAIKAQGGKVAPAANPTNPWSPQGTVILPQTLQPQAVPVMLQPRVMYSSPMMYSAPSRMVIRQGPLLPRVFGGACANGT